MKLAFAAMMAMAAPEFAVGDLQEYRDWVVGCDNLTACHATSMPEERYEGGDEEPIGDGNLSVSLRTSAVPGEALRVDLAILAELDLRTRAAIEQIAIDGRPIDFVPLGYEVGHFALDAEKSARFIQESRTASRVALLHRDGREVAAASLRGWREALSYIDARQYRTGTRASLASPGPVAWDFGVIPIRTPQIPIVVAPKSDNPPVDPDANKLAELRALDPCLAYSKDATPDYPEYDRLDDTHSLLILPTTCGGYNPYRMAFIIDENREARKAEFWPYPGNDMKEEPDLPDLYWDRESRTLHTFGRGRGVSDCGEAAEYVWDKGKFRLVLFKSMYPCRGSFDYITTYRREVKIARPDTPKNQRQPDRPSPPGQP